MDMDIKNSLLNLSLEQWNCIFSIVGVVATVCAVFVAIWIPKKIAKKQDAIQLFDKRYELFESVNLFIKMRNDIWYYVHNHPSVPDSSYAKTFFVEQLRKSIDAESDFEILLKLKELSFACEHKIPLLFSNIEILVIKDIESLITILEDSYNEEKFDLDYIDDDKFCEWVNMNNVCDDKTDKKVYLLNVYKKLNCDMEKKMNIMY